MNKQTLKLGARIFENLPTMTSEVMQGWIENPEALKKFLSGLSPVLTSLSPVTVVGQTEILQEFFQNRPGLLVSREFKYMLLAEASKREVSVGERSIGRADLMRKADNYPEIINQLPEGGVFKDVNTLLIQLANMIKYQKAGECGDLLNDGGVNTFFCREGSRDLIKVVMLRWEPKKQDWFCDSSFLHSGEVRMGTRIFTAIIPED